MRRVSRSYEELAARHDQDYGPLFRAATLELEHDAALVRLPTDARLARVRQGAADPGLVALAFAYGRYLLISSSRPGSLPANLQGLWNEHVRPTWSSNYTTNINVQMNYWPAEVTGLGQCHLPLFEWMAGMASRRDPYGAVGLRLRWMGRAPQRRCLGS